MVRAPRQSNHPFDGETQFSAVLKLGQLIARQTGDSQFDPFGDWDQDFTSRIIREHFEALERRRWWNLLEHVSTLPIADHPERLRPWGCWS